MPDNLMNKCPKCGYENTGNALYCGLCHEVFRKEQAIRESIPALEQSEIVIRNTRQFEDSTKTEATQQEFDQSWMWCLISFIIALFITPKLYFVWFPFRFITTVAHEFGHTILSWLFGFFTIPAVNPLDCGGVAISISYMGWISYIIIAVLAWITYQLRVVKCGILLGLSAMIIYAVAAFTPIKDWLIAGGGILGEYVLAGICLYRCLYKGTFKFNVERILYGILGWFALKQELIYLYTLITDKQAYETYVSGSSWQAGMTGDLAKIAFDINYRFSMNSFDKIVSGFIILGLLVPIPIIVYFVYKKNAIKTRSL
jgi:hypothetical protein